MAYSKVNPTFNPKFGFRTIKSLTGQLNKAIVLKKADDLQFSRGDSCSVANHMGNCLELDSSKDECVSIDHHASLNKSTNDGGIECWINIASSNSQSINTIYEKWLNDAGEQLYVGIR